MAEAQSPVIVEEDNENIVPPADNRTGERIEAGEVALANEGEVTTDASGRPKIEIKLGNSTA